MSIYSLGYGVSEMPDSDDSLCSLGEQDLMDKANENAYMIHLTENSQLRSQEITNLNHTYNTTDVGYICEQEGTVS